MFKKIISFSGFLILLMNGYLSAQNKLFLCTEYDKNGEFKGAYENWTIQKGGNYMYIYYQSSTLINDTAYVMIDRVFNRKDNVFQEYDHYYLVPDVSKKWAVNKYTFTNPGKYRINVYDRNSKLLAAPYITYINLEESFYNDQLIVDTWYYTSSQIYFYEKAEGDSMIGKNNIFPYQQEGTKVFLYIGQDNKSPFKTSHFVANIYTDDTCRELVNSSTYYVDKSWHWTFIPVYFERKGKFIVELYNDNDVFINSGKLEIK